MNHNESYFRQKFAECGNFLHVDPHSLVSLKYRRVSDHRFYEDLLMRLRSVPGLLITDLGNTLNGQAYLLSYGRQSVVLVEHETGLETALHRRFSRWYHRTCPADHLHAAKSSSRVRSHRARL